MIKQKIKLLLIVFLFFILNIRYANAEDVLLNRSNLVYKGAFRVPKGAKPNSVFSSALSFSGKAFSYRTPTIGAPNGSLYISDRNNLIAELIIPSIIKNPKIENDCPSHNVTCLTTAEWKQGFMDLTQGNRIYTWNNHTVSSALDENVIWSTLVFENRLIGSILTTYAAGENSQTHEIGPVYTHFSSNLDWDISIPSSAQFEGLYKLNAYPSDAIKNAGMTGGYMAKIPLSWQGLLGGKVLTGMIRQSTISNGSYGPTLVSFDPQNLTGPNTNEIPANFLVGYPSGTNFFSYTEAPQERGSMNLGVRGAVFPVGSRTVILFGYTGLGITGQGDSCYGENSADVTQTMTKEEITAWWNSNEKPATYRCGSTDIKINQITGIPDNPCCFNAAYSTKGNHSYPYIERVWLYDASELAEVKAGNRSYDSVLPYDQFNLTNYSIVPYRTWDYDNGKLSTERNANYSYTRIENPDDIPFAVAHDQILGAAYDEENQLIYLLQKDSDKPGLEPFPLVHVLEVQIGDQMAPIGPNGLLVE